MECTCGEECKYPLTEVEKSEFEKQIKEAIPFSPERESIRKRIAKKIFNHTKNLSSPEELSLMEKFPFWKYYTSRDGKDAFRVIGLARSSEGKIGLRAICALPTPSGLLEYGMYSPEEDLIPLDHWTPRHKAVIYASRSALLFYDPIGFAYSIPKGGANP